MASIPNTGVRLSLAGLVVLLGLAALPGDPSRAGQGGDVDPKPRILYEISGIGQFGLTAVDAKDKKIPITFAPNGNTNTTVLRIDGKDVEFGSKAGKIVELKGKLGEGKKGEKTVWSFGDIQVTQTLEIVPSNQPVDGKRLMDSVLITWGIKNTGDKAHEVGLRCVIDTAVGGYDGNPFIVAGKDKELVKTSADFKADVMPKFVKGLEEEDLAKPGYAAFFTLKVGGGVQSPDRFCITTWPGTTRDWEVQVKNITGDSAVVLYWNPAKLEPNASRGPIGFACGGGEVLLKGKE
jgi:hypothetical protein